MKTIDNTAPAQSVASRQEAWEASLYPLPRAAQKTAD
jgi:hypothetical protein